MQYFSELRSIWTQVRAVWTRSKQIQTAPRIGYVGNIINYLCHLPDPFPRGLWKDLEGSSTFLPLMLLMYIDRIRLA